MSNAEYINGVRTFHMTVRPIGENLFVLDGPFGAVDSGSRATIEATLAEIVPASLVSIYPFLGRRTEYVVTWEQAGSAE